MNGDTFTRDMLMDRRVGRLFPLPIAAEIRSAAGPLRRSPAGSSMIASVCFSGSSGRAAVPTASWGFVEI